MDGCNGVRLRASLAISSGANAKVVQRLLGHKTAVLTLDRYGHLFPDDLDAVAAATTADDHVPPRNQAPSKGGLTCVAGTGFEPV